MKSVKVTLGKELQGVQLHIFSDWHIGDAFCNYDGIAAQVDEVAANSNVYVIINGDLINNATKSSVSDSYAEKIPPMEQLSKLLYYLTPIKDRILIGTSGNHENRTYKDDGIDLTQLVFRQLGIEDRYCKEGGVLFLRFGSGYERHPERHQVYTLYITHGSGGGRKEGGKAVRLADLASIVDTDIYIHGHVHLPMIMKEAFFRTTINNNSVTKVTKLFVNTAAQLEYGGYGQQYGFKPACTDNPVIYLSGTKKQFTARL